MSRAFGQGLSRLPIYEDLHVTMNQRSVCQNAPASSTTPFVARFTFDNIKNPSPAI